MNPGLSWTVYIMEVSVGRGFTVAIELEIILKK